MTLDPVMTLDLSWQQIALRLLLASLASLAIGVNRDEHGRAAGMRTTMLVTLAAALVMVAVNLLLPMRGKPADSYIQLDLMRLPLGILSGIGFIGAGAILKKENRAIGVTTAATLWFTTVLGLLFGAGLLRLAIAATLLALLILTVLRYVEHWVPRSQRASLTFHLGPGAPSREALLILVTAHGAHIKAVSADYARDQASLSLLRCELQWRSTEKNAPEMLRRFDELRTIPGVLSFRWDQPLTD